MSNIIETEQLQIYRYVRPTLQLRYPQKKFDPFPLWDPNPIIKVTTGPPDQTLQMK